MDKPRPKVGDEFRSGGSPVLDLRNVKPKPVLPHLTNKTTAHRPVIPDTFKPAAEVVRRATTPPVRVSFHPVQITKTQTAKKSFIDGFAYDLLFIALAFFVDLATPFRDWLFLAYLVAALVFRISSQRIFRSALFCLVAIPLLTQLKRTDAADGFAVFTFFFLSIGVIRAIFELRNED